MYRCDLVSPSGGRTVRIYPAAQVVHNTYSTDRGQPWKGISPLSWARLTGRLSAEVEQALGDESSTTRGFVLPIPTDGEDASVEKLRSDLAKLKGKTTLVESTASNWGSGNQAPPQRDWSLRD